MDQIIPCTVTAVAKVTQAAVSNDFPIVLVVSVTDPTQTPVQGLERGPGDNAIEIVALQGALSVSDIPSGELHLSINLPGIYVLRVTPSAGPWLEAGQVFAIRVRQHIHLRPKLQGQTLLAVTLPAHI